MSTYSETIQARYAAFEQETDAFGRTIKVQRLRPWDMSVVRKLADTDRTSVISSVMVASCVRSIIDEAGKERLFAPPKSEDDVAIIMNALDSEGLNSAIAAWMRLMGVKPAGAGQDGEGGVIESGDAQGAQAAKN